jgi:uncharacterized protein (DUF934 family)
MATDHRGQRRGEAGGMTWLELATGNLVRRGVVGHVVSGADLQSALGGDDFTDPAGAALAIRFEKFSDGRGFTLARHAREALGFAGHLVAQGHVIPDQADYLRRCGFTHVEIDRQAARQWRRSLALAPPAMQRILGSQRSRATDPDRSAAPPERPDRDTD